MLNLTWKFLPDRFGDPWSFSSFVKDLNEGHIDLIGSGWYGRYSRFKETGGMSTPEYFHDGAAIHRTG